MCVLKRTHVLDGGHTTTKTTHGLTYGRADKPRKDGECVFRPRGDVMETREARRGDSVRNLSIGFVDDIHLRVAYSLRGGSDW